MASLNRQQIIGRLGKDPEVKQGQGSGKSYCFVSVATFCRWRDESEVVVH